MALSGSTVWEVRPAGSDTNGGGFVAGASGTDWSQQVAAQYAVTDGVTNGTTTITSATAAFGTDVVGNIMYVAGGTGSVAAGWYQIVSRTSSTAVVVDRSTGLTAGTGVTLNVGGALASPGLAAALATVAGMYIYIKYSATPYALTTTTAGASGPMVTSSITMGIEGYDATRGDRTGNRPTLQWQTTSGVSTYAIVLNLSAWQCVNNIAVDGNSKVNSSGINLGSNRNSVVDCVVKNCNQSNCIGYFGGGDVIRSRSNSNTTGFSGLHLAAGCDALGGTTGFLGGVTSIGCLARGMATGFSISGTGFSYLRCTADSCTTAGFSVSGLAALYGCLATNCSGVGAIGFSVGTNIATMYSCAVYNNTTHVSGSPLVNEGLITLSADPYVSQATSDFRPNSNNPGGAQLWGVGFGVFGQTNNIDVGAVQHSDPTSGGSHTFVVGGQGYPPDW